MAILHGFMVIEQKRAATVTNAKQAAMVTGLRKRLKSWRPRNGYCHGSQVTVTEAKEETMVTEVSGVNRSQRTW